MPLQEKESENIRTAEILHKGEEKENFESKITNKILTKTEKDKVEKKESIDWAERHQDQ